MPTPRNYVIAAIAASFFAAPAFAGSTDNVQSVEVKIAGYDLTSASGAAMVFDKIGSAAERVCDVHSTTRSIKLRQLAKSCVATTISNAVASVNVPALGRVHAAYETRKTG